MITPQNIKAMVLKDMQASEVSFIVSLIFGLFFTLMFIPMAIDVFEGSGQEEGSLFESEIGLFFLGFQYIVSVVCFPLMFASIFHKEIEDSTIKAIATYNISFHDYKLLKTISFMINGGFVFLLVGLMPLVLPLLVINIIFLIEAIMAMVALTVGMGFLAILSITINDY